MLVCHLPGNKLHAEGLSDALPLSSATLPAGLETMVFVDEGLHHLQGESEVACPPIAEIRVHTAEGELWTRPSSVSERPSLAALSSSPQHPTLGKAPDANVADLFCLCTVTKTSAWRQPA